MSKSIPVSDSLKTLLNLYKQLPYVTIKRYSRNYLLPQKPRTPLYYRFNIAAKAIKQHSQKYNQYYSPEKLREKTAQNYEEKIFTLNDADYKQKQEKKYQLLKAQHNHKIKNYLEKYIEPLSLMKKDGYNLFRNDQFQKLRLEAQNQKKLQNIQSQNNKNQQQMGHQKRYSSKKNILRGLQRINKINLGARWTKLSPGQKQIYMKKQQKIKAENEQKIQDFIANHEVPVIRRYSTIGRFLTRYAPIYQLKLSDKRLYEKYRQMTDQQKKLFSDQAKQMNRSSREKYELFLKKWNLSKGELQRIIYISDQYRKVYRARKTQTTKTNQIQKDRYTLPQDQEQSEDFQADYRNVNDQNKK